MTSTSTSGQVLIVGAGPVGLLTAILLARQGIASLLVERRTGRSHAPKAHALNPRSLEICRAAGIDLNQIYARQTPSDESRVVRFMSSLNGVELGSLPYERQDEAVLALTPTPLVNIAQPDFEMVLLKAAEQLPSIEIRFGHQWLSARESAEGVLSTIRQGASAEYTEQHRYVIACDGAGSVVRTSLDVAMLGDAELVNSVNIHFKADLHPATGDRPAILYWILDPAIAGTFIVYNLGSSIVYVWRYDPAKESPESFTAERCRELVSAAIGDKSIQFEILGARTWVMTAQVASQYRKGQVFLAGDAAHRFPPTGGLGLNTGIGDAQNLAWKMGLVWNGYALDALLDTYEAERRPIAVVNSNQSFVNAARLAELFALVEGSNDHVIPFSERIQDPAFRAALHHSIERQRQHFDSLGLQLGYIYGEPDSVPEDVSVYTPLFRLGGRLPHAWVQQSGRTISTLDLLSDTAFTLIVDKADHDWTDAAAKLHVPVRVIRQGSDFIDSDGVWSRHSGLATGGALFVRPDGHIALQANDSTDASSRLSGSAAQFSGQAQRDGSTMAASFRNFVPSPDHWRQKFLHLDSRAYSDLMLEDSYTRSLFAGWNANAEQPYQGLTADGVADTSLFCLEDERAPVAEVLNAVNRMLSIATGLEQDRLLLPIESSAWRKWSNPEIYANHHGLRLDEISHTLRQAILNIVKASLSDYGYTKARDCMHVNGFLGDVVGAPRILNKFSYNFTLFGEPSLTEPWGWQLHGHHLAINCMLQKNQMVVAPCFWGAEPNEVDEGPLRGLKMFEDEELGGLALMQSLPPSLRTQAQLYPSPAQKMPVSRMHPADHFNLVGAGYDNRIVPYEGVSARLFDATTKRQLLSLIEAYHRHLPDGSRLAKMTACDRHLNNTSFCWIGATGPDDPFYYRIQSPVTVIEFDHHAGIFLTNETAQKFHIHTIVRTPNGNDYGMALIKLRCEERARKGARYNNT